MVYFCSAAYIGALAAPTLIAGLYEAPALQAQLKLRAGHDLTDSDRALLSRSLEQALRWEATGERLADLGYLRLLSATDATGEDGLKAVLDAAEEALRAAMLRDPAEPMTWTRLAYLLMIRDGATPEAAAALEMALLTGPRERDALFPLVEASFILWDVATPATRAAIRRHLLFAWGVNRKLTRRLAEDQGGSGILDMRIPTQSGQ